MTTEKKSILVIDDDPDSQAFARDALVRDGYGVECASGCPEAIALLAERNVDLVLADMRMPGINGEMSDVAGVELSQYIRANCPAMPMMVMTGIPSIKRYNQMKDDDIFYLSKAETTSAELREAVARAFQRFEQQLARLKSMRYPASTPGWSE